MWNWLKNLFRTVTRFFQRAVQGGQPPPGEDGQGEANDNAADNVEDNGYDPVAAEAARKAAEERKRQQDIERREREFERWRAQMYLDNYSETTAAPSTTIPDSETAQVQVFVLYTAAGSPSIDESLTPWEQLQQLLTVAGGNPEVLETLQAAPASVGLSQLNIQMMQLYLGQDATQVLSLEEQSAVADEFIADLQARAPGFGFTISDEEADLPASVVYGMFVERLRNSPHFNVAMLDADYFVAATSHIFAPVAQGSDITTDVYAWAAEHYPEWGVQAGGPYGGGFAFGDPNQLQAAVDQYLATTAGNLGFDLEDYGFSETGGTYSDASQVYGAIGSYLSELQQQEQGDMAQNIQLARNGQFDQIEPHLQEWAHQVYGLFASRQGQDDSEWAMTNATLLYSEAVPSQYEAEQNRLMSIQQELNDLRNAYASEYDAPPDHTLLVMAASMAGIVLEGPVGYWVDLGVSLAETVNDLQHGDLGGALFNVAAAGLPFLQGWMDEAADVGHAVGFSEMGTGSDFPQYAVSQVPTPTMLNQELGMSCSPASCAQYLRDRGVDVSERELRSFMMVSDEIGTGTTMVLPGLERFLNSRGISDIQIGGRSGNATAEDLHRLLGDHGSILVMITTGSSGGGVENHMVIVDQISDNLVTIRNPWGISGPGSGMGTIETYETSVFLEFWYNAIGLSWWAK